MGLLKAKNEDEELIRGLQRARSKWFARSYEPSIWQATNEQRRSQRIKTIDSLIKFYNEKGNLTEGQRELAKRLINNVNEKGV